MTTEFCIHWCLDRVFNCKARSTLGLDQHILHVTNAALVPEKLSITSDGSGPTSLLLSLVASRSLLSLIIPQATLNINFVPNECIGFQVIGESALSLTGNLVFCGSVMSSSMSREQSSMAIVPPKEHAEEEAKTQNTPPLVIVTKVMKGGTSANMIHPRKRSRMLMLPKTQTHSRTDIPKETFAPASMMTVQVMASEGINYKSGTHIPSAKVLGKRA
ncbi:uncharacterized protein LAESUDRAFT_718600, partial [Laetiporus sulphureus 93-53]